MIAQFFSGVIEKIKASIRAALREAALLGAAGLFGLLVLIFLILAAYSALDQWLGPVAAALILAGAFLVIGGLCVAASGVLQSEKKPVAAAPLEKSQLEKVASNLAGNGFRKEGAILQAAAAAARDVRPVHILAMSLIGGFVLGRRFEKK